MNANRDRCPGRGIATPAERLAVAALDEMPDEDGDAAGPPPGTAAPTICGESGTTRSSGPGLDASCSVRRAPATSPFTNRPSLVSPSGFVCSASRRPRSRATSSDSTPRSRRRGRSQVARTATRSAAPKGARLAPAAAASGPPVSRQDPGRPFPGRARRAGEGGPEARRGHRRRRARRGSPLLVELGEVADEGSCPRDPGPAARSRRTSWGSTRRSAGADHRPGDVTAEVSENGR